jgi:D-tyrosyl-tRNA(Tyr) deacylase
MRALIQRVLTASVTVEGAIVGQIGPGLLVFLGVGKGDREQEVEWAVEKLTNLRIFEDEAGKMNRSLLDTQRAVLLVSQFTLYADARKGRRPSFTDAAEPALAKRLYERCGALLGEVGLTVATGVFAADMKVALVNDGPVTLMLDSAA